MKLVKLHIENFFSFGSATIDFETKPSPVLIKGISGDTSQSNGSGKSSMLEAFFWSLTGKTVRGVRAADVVRLGEKQCVVVAELEFNSQKLRITRSYSFSKKTVEIEYNGKSESFHDSKQGTERIFEILGVRDDTLALACFYGSGFITFSGLGPQARSDVIDLLAQGSKWELARALATTQARDFGIEWAKSHTVWDQLNKDRASKEESLATSQGAYKAKRSELGDLIEVARSKVDKFDSEVKDIDRELASLETTDPEVFAVAIGELEELKNSTNTAKEEASVETITLGKSTQASIKILQDKLDASKSAGNTAYRSRTSTEMRIESITREVKSLQTEVETNACASCGQVLPLTDNGEERSTRIQERTATLLKLEQDLIDSDMVRDSSSQESEAYTKEIEELTTTADSLRSKLTADNQKADESITIINNEIASIRKREHEDTQKSAILDRKRSSMMESLSSSREELTRLESNEDLIRLQTTVENLQTEIGTYAPRIESQLKKADEFHVEEAKSKFWAVSFKDIRFAAFENTVQAFESMLNSYSEQQGLDFDRIEVSSRKVLSTGKEKPQIEIYLHRGDERLSLDALSEGETQRVNIACFLAIGALIEKHVGYPLQLKIFDEPLGGVDADGKQKIFQILSDLADSGRQVLTIDHDAHFQDLCPTVITVSKTNGVSRIL